MGPVHNSMYRYLWSNGPKECLEFADYTFEEHFGKPIPSYPPREVLLDYIKGRLDKTPALKESCKFKHSVKDVSYSDETGKFTVRVCDLVNKTEITETFDWVIGCCGHFTTPNIPHFPGFE